MTFVSATLPYNEAVCKQLLNAFVIAARSRPAGALSATLDIAARNFGTRMARVV
jgi:hypothetical protein